jgi:hypothetical protein
LCEINYVGLLIKGRNKSKMFDGRLLNISGPKREELRKDDKIT